MTYQHKPAAKAAPDLSRPAATTRMESVITGSAAVFGIVVSATLGAVAIAGFLQWGPRYPAALDDGLPLVIVVAGMLLAGRVAVDVAGDLGVWSVVGATLIVAVLGYSVSMSSEAHGDGIEFNQVLLAAGVVLALSAGSAWTVARRRRRKRARHHIAL
jgi:hypothetical protein